mmetsp:Transcript_49159/g.106917  ORF Transcript_49159/g.106917 Transcript_49159/m.106917 type:complete len:239 (-) Transcript_49159:140-856(-)
MGRPSRRGPAVLALTALAFGLFWASETFVSPAGRRSCLTNSRSPPASPEARVVSAQFFGDSDAPAVKETVVIQEDYRLAAIFFTLGLVLSSALPYAGFGFGLFVLLLGVLFFVQTGRLRFIFDEEAFELKTVGGDEKLNESGENVLVGGENRWKYKSFVNWEFFPKGLVEQGIPPILVYFKETQTPKEKWMKGPGASANSPEAIEGGAVAGQVHFFPCICNAQQIKAEFEKRGCQKLQ